MITVTRSAEHNHADSSAEDPIAEEGDRKVLKEVFNMISRDGRHCCIPMCQLKVDEGHEWTERPHRVPQVIPRDVQATGRAETVKLSQMTKFSIEILNIYHLFLSVIKVVLNYAGALKLQYGMSLAKACIKHTIDDI